MKILAFDVSNNTTSVAISEGQKILAYSEDLRSSVQAERLFPMIEECLSSARLTYEEIDYLAVTNGPGSFTGIRIGLASAKGILLSTKIKGTSVSNFEIAYYRATMQTKNYDKIIVLLNAYRNQLYVQIFDKFGKSNKPQLIDYDVIHDLIKEYTEHIVFVGSGIFFIHNKIKSLSNATILPRFSRIKALHICRYVDYSIGSKGLSEIEPLYIRPPDAKVVEKPSTF